MVEIFFFEFHSKEVQVDNNLYKFHVHQCQAQIEI